MTGSRTALRPGWAFASWKRDIASEDRMRQSRLSSRYFLAESDPHDERATFGEEIAQGLRAARKWIPCRFMYDQAGSGLFEEICDLPEYYVTRAERQILEDHSDEIAGSFAEPVSLAELGSGSSLKTRLLIEAFLRRQGTLRYVPVDISRSMLDESARELLDDYGGLEIHAIASEYVDGLRRVGGETERPKLIAWLGSNVGNFDRAAASRFLRRIRDAMGERDRLLLGVDLRKDRAVLEAAYDDAAGVTARFNLNLLERINRDLDGGFDVGAFAHRARYLEDEGRVVLELVSRRDQQVQIGALDLVVDLAAGEAIHTEDSYKYSFDEVAALAAAADLEIERRWLDVHGYFSLHLLRR
jgi:dimethylhistidine N-methyltransferase